MRRFHRALLTLAFVAALAAALLIEALTGSALAAWISIGVMLLALLLAGTLGWGDDESDAGDGDGDGFDV